jgi:hypothetical protein
MFESIVESIICNTFDKFGRRGTGQAMDIRFRLSIDHEKEEGYRHLNLRIYAPNNYVMVLVKEDWNVIPTKDLIWDEKEQDYFIDKNSKGYVNGETEWQLVSFHDSCWRTDGVHNILWKNRERILHIDTLGSTDAWYNKVNLSSDEKEKMKKELINNHYM